MHKLFEITQQVAPCMAVNITVNNGGHAALAIPAAHPSLAKLCLVTITPMGYNRFSCHAVEDILHPFAFGGNWEAYIQHRKEYMLLSCFHGRWGWPAAFVHVLPASTAVYNNMIYPIRYNG